MSLTILGMGTAVPPDSFDQREGLMLAQSLCCRTEEQMTWLPNMYGHTGIDKRHLCLGRELVNDVLGGTRLTQSPFLPTRTEDDRGPSTRERMEYYAKQAPLMASRAALEALQRSGISARAITHLVTISCTGFHAPGWDVMMVPDLGLSNTTERTHVGFMGCHGALNGLRVARAFAEADSNAKVLVCATEICSIHYHYGWDPQKVIANAIFADGAAALVGGAGSASKNCWELAASASCLIAESDDAMTWDIGNHGFVMTLSKRVTEIIRTKLRAFVEPWLARHGLAIEEIPSWAIHPGGPKILDAAAEALGLAPDLLMPAREVFAAYGNMSSPTVLFILDQLQKSGSKPPCVALGFGPGLNVEAALFR